MIRWQCAVTTVPQRLGTTLVRTLESLKRAGFPEPMIHNDSHKLGVVGNWILAAWTIYLQNPKADRYAIFQDDILLCRNVRQYLDQLTFPMPKMPHGYWNLYTTPEDEDLNKFGWHPSAQNGRGALALVFDNDGLATVLSSRNIVEKPRAVKHPTKGLDGVLVTLINNIGWREYIHHPSLVMHQRAQSTIGHGILPTPQLWPGEEHDSLEMIKCLRR